MGISMSMLLAMVLKIVCAYLLGSLSGSLLLGMIRKVDIRTMGSGNAGGTNALRTQGLWFALGVVVIDIGKGVLACTLIIWLPPVASASVQPWVITACGLAAVAGHIWPVFFGFRGGKGAGTMAGATLVIAPLAGVLTLLSWGLVLILSGYVGLATVTAAVCLPVFLLLTGYSQQASLVFCLLSAALMCWTHRSNIRRLLDGNENRFEKVRWQNWGSRQ